MIPSTAGPDPAKSVWTPLEVARVKKDFMDVAVVAVTVVLVERPRIAKAVRQMSKGYVASVAAVPAAAPEQNATAVGLEPILCSVVLASCRGWVR